MDNEPSIEYTGEYLPPTEHTPQAVAVCMIVNGKQFGADPIAFVYPDGDGVSICWREDIAIPLRAYVLEHVLAVTEGTLEALFGGIAAVGLAMAPALARAPCQPTICLN